MAESIGGENPQKNVVEEVSRISALAKELQESSASLISRSSSEEASLRQRALTLDSNIKNLRVSIASSVKRGNLVPKDAEKVTNIILTCTLLCFLIKFVYVFVCYSV